MQNVILTDFAPAIIQQSTVQILKCKRGICKWLLAWLLDICISIGSNATESGYTKPFGILFPIKKRVILKKCEVGGTTHKESCMTLIGNAFGIYLLVKHLIMYTN